MKGQKNKMRGEDTKKETIKKLVVYEEAVRDGK